MKIAVLLGLFGGVAMVCAAAASSADVDRAWAQKLSLEQYNATVQELAFDAQEALMYEQPALSAAGRLLAYTVKRKPREPAGQAAYMPGAASPYHEGARIHLLEKTPSGSMSVPICSEAGDSWGPVWSPDGGTLAFYANKENKPSLWIYEAERRSCRRLAAVAITALVDPPKWSPEGRVLYISTLDSQGRDDTQEPSSPVASKSVVTILRSATVREDEQSDGEIEKSGEGRKRQIGSSYALTAVDVHKGEVRVLVSSAAQPAPAVMRVSPSGRWVSYVSVIEQSSIAGKYTRSLAVVPASGGAPRLVAEGLPELWGAGSVRLNYAWHPTRDRLVYWKDGGVWLVDLETNGLSAPRPLAPELGPLDSTIYWFTRDGRAVVVGSDALHSRLGDRPNQTPRTLALVTLDEGDVTRLPIGDRWEFSNVIRANLSMAWQPDTRSLMLRVREKSTDRSAILQVDTKTAAERVRWLGHARLAGEEAVVSSDHSRLYSLFEDMHTPPALYEFSADFARKQHLVTIDPRLHAVQVGSAEVFETQVPMHDGSIQTRRSAVLLPAGTKRGDRLPAIVMLYPASNTTRDIESFGGGTTNSVPNMLFTASGLAVLLVHAELGPVGVGKAQDVIKNLTDTVLPQVYRAADLGYVDIRRLALSGQSFGGYATAAIVSQTNLFRAAIPINGPYDLGAEYGRLSTETSSSGLAINMSWAEYQQGGMGFPPWSNVLRYIENSPYYRADKIHTPMLIVTGAADTRVPSEESKKLFAALRRLSKPAILAFYPGQDHVISDWSLDAAMDVSRRMIDFLKGQLGDPPAVGMQGE